MFQILACNLDWHEFSFYTLSRLRKLKNKLITLSFMLASTAVNNTGLYPWLSPHTLFRGNYSDVNIETRVRIGWYHMGLFRRPPTFKSQKVGGGGVTEHYARTFKISLFLSRSRSRTRMQTLSLSHTHTLARTPCGVFRDHATASTWDPHSSSSSSSKQRHGWWPPHGTPPLIISESEDKIRRSNRPTMRPHGTRDSATHGPARG